MEGIAERLATVRGRIRAAAGRAGRDPAGVRLVAVSKTRSVEEIAEARRAGQIEFGENRVQEAERKVEAGLPPDVTLHLVGHLQGNKARTAARLFRVVHSVDGWDILEALERHARGPLEALVQIDLAGEPTKHGLAPAALGDLLGRADRLERVRVVGLMVLPPFLEDPERVRPYFRALAELRGAHGGPARLPHLSMGMSHDLEVAVEEGATMVRVGEAVFGPRLPYPPAAGRAPR